MKRELTISQQTNDPTTDLVLDTLRINKQALVFVSSKRSAEKTAEDIAKKIKLEEKRKIELEQLGEEARTALSKPTKQCERLAYCLKKGIAFHHAGLVQDQKELIEDNFRTGKVKIICCTPTLAAGVDLPSFRTILKDLKRFSSPRGMVWISVLEYEQMAGRSGRPRYDTYGEAIAIASTEKDKEAIYDRYICGTPEEIYSKLAVEPVLRTYVLSLIATEFVTTKQELVDFFSKTFWAYQFEDMGKLGSIIDKMLDMLEEFEFIRTTDTKTDEFRSASEMAEGRIIATIVGKRVAELYLDPLTAHQIITCLKRAPDRPVREFSFLHMVSLRLEMRPLLRVKTKEWDTIQQQLPEYLDCLLEDEPSLYDPDYEDFINAFKTALFFRDWMDEKEEEQLLEKHDIRPGEIRVKLDLADWLLYAAEELARLMHYQPILKEISKTRFRLKYGVREELLPLLKLEGIGRVRARKLFNNKIHDIRDVKAADIMALSQLIGPGIARSVKQQVGQDVGKLPVRENKRKGQISLKDYDGSVSEKTAD